MCKTNIKYYNYTMVARDLERIIPTHSAGYPAVALVGPRQSGKTTLSRRVWPDHTYISLESLDWRAKAESDPRGFLKDLGDRIILDEIQRAPGLFSYLQDWLDEGGHHAVLTGSQQFLLMQGIGQSLAGRVAHFELLPLGWSELSGKAGRDPWESVRGEGSGEPPQSSTVEILHKGLYPRIHDKGLRAHKWLDDYLRTYVERDVRSLSQVADLAQFTLLLKLLATQAGSLLNMASLATQVGASIPTVKRWISILETSGIVFLLQPHHANFGKRLLKSPKPYFVDSGLLCLLLGIREPKHLTAHPLRGHVFENFVISEFRKLFLHNGERAPLYFWRDSHGLEVDLLVEDGSDLLPIEIKSTATWRPDLEAPLRKWMEISGNQQGTGLVVYDGEASHHGTSPVKIMPWWRVV